MIDRKQNDNRKWSPQCLPTVPEMNAIVEGARVVLQITASVTCSEYVSGQRSTTSVDMHSNQTILVEVTARSSTTFWFLEEFSEMFTFDFILEVLLYQEV